jgi:AcrR family transcriptional regulator
LLLRGGGVGRNLCCGEIGIKKRPNLLAGEKLSAEPRQERSLVKRRRLNEAGLAVFGEKGFEQATISEISRRAGLATGGFYQHYRSKKQLLLALMDELLEKLSHLELSAQPATDVRSGLHDLLAGAFSHDMRYLGAYRAWQEAVLSHPDLTRKQAEIHSWTTSRVVAVFQHLQKLPGARVGVDVEGLAKAMDSFFWSLLAQAVRMPKAELIRWTDSATHLIYHALFLDISKKE